MFSRKSLRFPWSTVAPPGKLYKRRGVLSFPRKLTILGGSELPAVPGEIPFVEEKGTTKYTIAILNRRMTITIFRGDFAAFLYTKDPCYLQVFGDVNFSRFLVPETSHRHWLRSLRSTAPHRTVGSSCEEKRIPRGNETRGERRGGWKRKTARKGYALDPAHQLTLSLSSFLGLSFFLHCHPLSPCADRSSPLCQWLREHYGSVKTRKLNFSAYFQLTWVANLTLGTCLQVTLFCMKYIFATLVPHIWDDFNLPKNIFSQYIEREKLDFSPFIEFHFLRWLLVIMFCTVTRDICNWTMHSYL